MNDTGAIYLALDDDPTPATRVAVADADYPEVMGLSLDFDEAGHLVGVEFEDPPRHVPDGVLDRRHPLRVTHDRSVRAAYLYLQPIGRRGVAETLAFGDEDTRPAWGVNLDFDKAWRLVGIEFEAAELAPTALLARADGPG
jgi:uncharacterized protein YuzE